MCADTCESIQVSKVFGKVWRLQCQEQVQNGLPSESEKEY